MVLQNPKIPTTFFSLEPVKLAGFLFESMQLEHLFPFICGTNGIPMASPSSKQVLFCMLTLLNCWLLHSQLVILYLTPTQAFFHEACVFQTDIYIGD